MTAYKIIVRGRVQGVYYRKTIQEKAKKYGFSGYIKNLSNGDVEVGVMLDACNYETFIKILKDGSPYSLVNNLDIQQTNDSFNDFTIKY